MPPVKGAVSRRRAGGWFLSTGAPIYRLAVLIDMATRGSYLHYRRKLVAHSRVVEVDGDSHFTAGGAKRDSVRGAALRHMGLNVVRFTNDDVMRRFEAVCLEIAAVFEEPKT